MIAQEAKQDGAYASDAHAYIITRGEFWFFFFHCQFFSEIQGFAALRA